MSDSPSLTSLYLASQRENADLKIDVGTLKTRAENAERREKFLRARVAELEAKAAIADSVPWKAILACAQYAENYTWAEHEAHVTFQFLAAHAPKGDAHQTSVPSAIDVADT